MIEHAGIARPRSLMVAHLLLLLAEGPRHGYELTETLRLWEFGVTTSVVYRDMAKLEEGGLVRSFWQASQARGPARHMYELTPAGRDDLVACADDVRRLNSHLTEFLSRFAGIPENGNGAEAPPVGGDARKTRRRFRKTH